MRRISSGWIIFLGIVLNFFISVSVIKYVAQWLIADMLYYLLTVSGMRLYENAAFLFTRFKEMGKDQSSVGRDFRGRFAKCSMILGLPAFGQLCRSCFGFPTNVWARNRTLTFSPTVEVRARTHTHTHTRTFSYSRTPALVETVQKGRGRSGTGPSVPLVSQPSEALSILPRVGRPRHSGFGKQRELLCQNQDNFCIKMKAIFFCLLWGLKQVWMLF